MHSLAFLVLTVVAQDTPAVKPPTYAEVIAAAHDRALTGDVDRAQRELDGTALADRGFEWMHVRAAIELERENNAALGFTMHGRMPVEIYRPRVTAISTLNSHGTPCLAVAIAPAGDRIASGGGEHEVRLWNARTGDPEPALVGHSGGIVGLAFANDGKRLLSASTDGSAKLWEPDSGRVALTLRATGEPLSACAWSADNAWIATADGARAVRLWSAHTNEARFAARGHAHTINALAFSSDGKYVASGSEDGAMRILDSLSGDVVKTFWGTGMPCDALRFDPLAPRLVMGMRDGSLRCIDLANGVRTDPLAPTADAIRSIAVTRDGKRWATGTEQGWVTIRDAALQPLLALHVGNAAIRSLCFDAQAIRLVACGDDRTVFVIETDANLARTLQRTRAAELPSAESAGAMKPMEVDAACRRVVERAGLSPELYSEAEALARTTFERAPNSGQIMTTLGGALYRLERYEEALETLTAAGDLKRGWPANLAFRVGTLVRLQRPEEARVMLQRLETLMNEKRWSSDVEARALLEEARSVVSTAPPAPK